MLDNLLKDSGSSNNFLGEDELSVTITLNEYRELIMIKGRIEEITKQRDDMKQKLEKLMTEKENEIRRKSFENNNDICIKSSENNNVLF